MAEEDQNNAGSKEQSVPEKEVNPKLKWYVVHTYSSFENRAQKALEERIKQQKFDKKFGEILIPTETVEEIRNGERRSQSRKCFPSYMLVQMEFTEETGHLVRNTSKITGFVGNAKIPPCLTSAEVERMRFMATEASKTKVTIEYCIGDTVKVTEGAFANFNGNVEEVKPDKQKVRVMVSIFGRSTPVELDYVQVERIS